MVLKCEKLFETMESHLNTNGDSAKNVEGIILIEVMEVKGG